MNKKTSRQIARFVRNARKDLEISQQALAKRIGVSRGFLSDIERGVRAISVDTLIALSRGLRATTDQILGRTAKPRVVAQARS